MTYASFLLIFLLPPALLLGAGLYRQVSRRALLLPAAVSVVAVLYTTPWDNYLVANRIWQYDPDRISGVLLGWVPLEEYLFFVLQPLLTGWWTVWLLRRSPSNTSSRPAPFPVSKWTRLAALLPLGLLWPGSLWALRSEVANLRYLALILIWALPPLALQLGYGAPALWRLRRAALWSIAPATIYLAAADSLAIAAGVWTISPRTSTGWLLFGVLPVEEFLFFLLTNTLIAFSVLLLYVPARSDRLA